ncbi:uncharacterized protein LOC119612284 [Lucilia sericata]|uniref:uncharacterized protein LOC119612284 n=1 Tax=Lucilia sericata TaxID=13632 RepID=UPI0018A82790|nr:uncharacterized protein LOC119612284 [Lucilia sericata]
MKLILGLTVLLVAVFVNQISVSSGTSQPVCGYKNAEDEMIFLKYFPYTKKGEEYVDFGKDGKCLKKVTCSETFTNQIEECKTFPVTCENKNNYNGVFPACCVKC